VTEEAVWPDLLPVGAVRFARRTSDLDAAVHFYRDLVGLPLLVEFGAGDGPDAFAGAIFGMPGPAVTFEIVETAEPVPVDPYEQLVLYLPGPTERDELVGRLKAFGLVSCAQYQYWDDNDAVTFRDPDGREVVFAPWVFGSDPPPARLKSEQDG
jgi:catechol 2,3-dioxygenase-like lactoylglutathione lyase family enzyme